MSKYRAIPTEVDGVRFASQKEARRYMELKLLQKAGEIRNLTLQPEFVLSVNRIDSVVIIGKYRGDFRYEERYCPMAPQSLRGPFVPMREAWATKVEDVKGFKTPLYRWKKKHVEAQYGIEIVEV